MKIIPAFLLGAVLAATAVNAVAGVTITEAGGKLRVELNGALFTEYHYKDVARPYLYPIIGPSGAQMTRDWPMKESEHDEKDHPHHKGLWYAHGAINGVDFWSEVKNFGKTVHEKFLKTGPDVISSRNNWVAPDGKTICADERTIRFYAPSDVRMLDYEITFIALEEPVTFGDTKEGSMAIRVAESMRVMKPAPKVPKETAPATKGKKDGGAAKPKPKPERGDGHIVNSEGIRDTEAWGKRATWVDYCGPVAGKTVGVAILDHPTNPKHPTWWHVRDYGLFGANPFGVHDFEKQPKGTGDVVLEPGKRLTWRYRFVFHDGDEKQGRVADRYREFAGK